VKGKRLPSGGATANLPPLRLQALQACAIAGFFLPKASYLFVFV